MRIQFEAQKETEIGTVGQRNAHKLITDLKTKYKQIQHPHGKVFAKQALTKYLEMSAQHISGHLSQKEVDHIRIAAKRLTSGRYTPLQLLNWRESQSSCLKDRIDHLLEILAYKFEREEYLKSYCKGFGYYGMNAEDASERFEKYHQGLLERDYVQAVYNGVKYWGNKKEK